MADAMELINLILNSRLVYKFARSSSDLPLITDANPKCTWATCFILEFYHYFIATHILVVGTV